MNDTELAGIVCARICHDLVSPVGAVVNGVDLIRELGTADAAEEMALVEQSARRGAALLKFHRLAFGAGGDRDATLARDQLRERVEDVLAWPRVRLGWSAPEGPGIALPVARLTCLMLLAARAMLGMSGTLRVVLPAGEALPVAVIAEGAKAVASVNQRHWLAGGLGPAPDSRQVEFALVGPAAAAAGARIELIEGAGQLALRAALV
ncbi:MAG: histidine phosphotransferase family protein [Alphaproteobacteria bacterium]